MWRLQALTTDLSPDARFSHDDSAHDARIRSDAAHAVLEATAEALRNSVQHAGSRRAPSMLESPTTRSR